MDRIHILSCKFVVGLFILSVLVLGHHAALAQQTCIDSTWSNGADEYFEAWAATEESARMYPFGPDYCDENAPGDFVDDIPFVSPFYGGNYEQINVFSRGFVSFGSSFQARYIPRQTWPNAAYEPFTNEIDPPMVVVYYNDAEIEEDESALYYRIVDPTLHTGSPNLLDIYTTTLDLLYNDTAAAIPSETFYPTRAAIVTWYRMYYERYGACGDACTNTYQAVILTDGSQTFTIINYYDVNWIGGGNFANCNGECDDCNPDTGTPEGGFDNCFLAQMGFNRGGGLEFTPLPLSSNVDQTSIDENSGVPSVNGRFIYEVSGTTMTRGGCASGGLVPDLWPLVVSPSSGIVLGGFEVSVSGTCLALTDTVTCRFGSDTAEDIAGTVMDEYRAMCVAPLLTKTGTIPVYMTIGETVQTNYGEIYVDPTQPSQPDVILVNSFNWFSPNASSLELTWDTEILNPENLTDQTVDVTLFGYRETVEGTQTISEWTMLASLDQAAENTGTWSFVPADHRCALEDCDWHMGALKLSVSSEDTTMVGGIWTEVIPLGWYVTAVLTEQYGTDWPTSMCTLWAGDSPGTATGPDNCPCSPTQAEADVGRFRLEASCGDGELTCVQGLGNCYVSVQPSASGAATRCCYEDEFLIYAGDQINASYSSLIHIDGASPFGAGRAPLMSHWFSDVVPYYWCCGWTDSLTTCRNNYANRRTTPDCNNYEPPGIGGSFGDPHMLSLDGLSYTFNGEGEFWLVRTTELADFENINIQGRMEPLSAGVGSGEATVMTAVVVQEGSTPETNTTRVQIERAAEDSQSALSVFVDGAAVDFSNPLTQSKEFYNFAGDRRTVLTPSDPITVEAVNVQMESGVGLSVIAINQTLAVTVSLPEAYTGVTSGLLGIQNGDTADDLTNSTGGVLPENSTTETIHNNFGLSWMTTPEDTRFTYIGAMNWTYFNNPDFVPLFVPNVTASDVTEEEVLAVCGDITSACAFDYVVTGDPYFAADTRNQEDSLLATQNDAEPITVCPRLDAPNSFKTVEGSYRVGSVVTFTGCEEGYEMRGTTQYTCLANGNWDEFFDFECSDGDDDLTLILAIVIPIAVILLIVLIVGAIYIYRHYDKEERPPPKQPVPAITSPVSMTQPNSDLYYTPGTDLSRSTSTVNNESGIHTLSRNSIILTQELKTARPPRPTSQRMPGSSVSSEDRADRGSINSSHSGMHPVYDNRVYQPDDSDFIDTRLQVPNIAHASPAPMNDQPPPTVRPKSYYDNLASIPDMDSTSSDSDNDDRPGAGVPTRTPPPEPRPLTLRTSYPPPTTQGPYEPKPFSYAAARPYTYTSEYAKPAKGGGISSSFV